jgi:opacity protein-like surface antigen
MPYAAPAPEAGGWYLRGDVGVSIGQTFNDFEHHQTNAAFVWPASWRLDQKSMGDSAIAGIGLGYAWNNWLRFDATAEHRTNVNVKVTGSYTEFCPSGRCFDVYDLQHGSNVFLANVYIDLGTWWSVTPFIGGGIGVASNTFKSATDVGYIPIGAPGFGYGSSNHTDWDMAWAAHAGLAYSVTQNFKVEFSYRFLSMGSPKTGIIDCASSGCATGGGPTAYYTLKNLSSNDFRIGLRYMIAPEQSAPPPLMRKG